MYLVEIIHSIQFYWPQEGWQQEWPIVLEQSMQRLYQ